MSQLNKYKNALETVNLLRSFKNKLKVLLQYKYTIKHIKSPFKLFNP